MTVRDEIRELLDELPEEDLPATRAAIETLRDRRAETAEPPGSFFATTSLEDLAARQRVEPVVSPDELQGDFWPADESVDDLLAAVRAWRRE